jgi:hypothetical protein
MTRIEKMPHRVVMEKINKKAMVDVFQHVEPSALEAY